MSERRLKLRYRRPGASQWADGIEWTQHDGPIVVVKSEKVRDAYRLAQALSGPKPKLPPDTPVLWMPPGSEFEVWEIES